jgi:hypothetical protein
MEKLNDLWQQYLEKLDKLYHQYLDQYLEPIIAWYNGLEEMYKYGVLFLLIAGSLFVFAFFILSRITK